MRIAITRPPAMVRVTWNDANIAIGDHHLSDVEAARKPVRRVSVGWLAAGSPDTYIVLAFTFDPPDAVDDTLVIPTPFIVDLEYLEVVKKGK
jgi:hypothetical protein